MSDHNETSVFSHVVPLGVYIAVFLSLMALTALTTGVAYIDLGAWNTVVALAIAVVKMLLVVLFFMHVKYTHERLTPMVIVSAIFFLGLLLSLSMTDYLSR